jgi:hypothetical protein
MEADLLTVLDQLYPIGVLQDDIIFCILFHVNRAFRTWLADKVPSRTTFWWCPVCKGYYWDHLGIAQLYKTSMCTNRQMRAVIYKMPSLLLISPFLEQCAEALIDHEDVEQLFRVANLVLRCKITPESTRLISLCFSGFSGCVLKVDLSGPRATSRAKWKQFREKAKKSAWASLFHKKKPWQIKQELYKRTWPSLKWPEKTRKRDASPTRE